MKAGDKELIRIEFFGVDPHTGARTIESRIHEIKTGLSVMVVGDNGQPYEVTDSGRVDKFGLRIFA